MEVRKMILGKTAQHILKTLRVKYQATRSELLAGIKPEHASKSKSWGNSYFLPAASTSNGYHSSLIRRGLVTKSKALKHHYILTSLGMQVADQLEEFRGEKYKCFAERMNDGEELENAFLAQIK
jgi:hypothetical protein